MKFSKNKSGFSLIELLVVISIFGFLVSVATYSLNSTRVSSRDARRIGDINQIQKALDLYYEDNTQYPPFFAYTGDSDDCGLNWCNLETVLAPYIVELARDPLGQQSDFVYYYDSDSGNNYQNYGIMYRLEASKNFHFATDDGGYFNDASFPARELGPQPKYCKDKYSGANSNWIGVENTVCAGGN